MEAMFGKEKNDPETVVGCVAEMKLTVLSEAGERITLVRKKGPHDHGDGKRSYRLYPALPNR